MEETWKHIQNLHRYTIVSWTMCLTKHGVKVSVKFLTEHGISEGLVLDLGCGTGTMTRLLRQKGYDMIGVDASAEMLEIARNHPDEGILYLQQDMREFELYGTVAAVVCVCDSLNYLLEEEDLAEVFSLVHNYLDQNGVFIFGHEYHSQIP